MSRALRRQRAPYVRRRYRFRMTSERPASGSERTTPVYDVIRTCPAAGRLSSAPGNACGRQEAAARERARRNR
jgi:hypothetical protein